MPRYVILSHDHPVPHFDLMLEAGLALRTWRLPSAPRPGQILAAEPLPDHRLTYLDYEGPVSGGRGTVRQWDAGCYDVLAETSSVLAVLLRGRVLRAQAVYSESEGVAAWRFQPAASD